MFQNATSKSSYKKCKIECDELQKLSYRMRKQPFCMQKQPFYVQKQCFYNLKA